jgi:hypothetical protein
MEKCKHCTLNGSPDQCFVQKDGFTFQCDLINPDHPKYNEGHVKIHRQRNGLDKLPSTMTMATNAIKAGIKFVADRGRKCSLETQKSRLDACKTCPHRLIKENGDRCNKCGCHLALKTLWQKESCPIEKWGPVDEDPFPTLVAESPPCGQCQNNTE